MSQSLTTTLATMAAGIVRNGWCQGMRSMWSSGVGWRYCLAGAMDRAADKLRGMLEPRRKMDVFEAHSELCWKLSKNLSTSNLMAWNDHVANSAEQVAVELEKAGGKPVASAADEYWESISEFDDQ